VDSGDILMNQNHLHHRAILQDIARRAMLARGLLPDFSNKALAELDNIRIPMISDGNPSQDLSNTQDLRHLLWASIDNDDSRDLDQLTVAEQMPSGVVKIFVAISDVATTIRDGSAIDQHARTNTTSVYTAAEIFPMLPEKISTDITSLNFDEDRLSIVVEIGVDKNGELGDTKISKAWVHNHAKLAYNSVAAWLDKIAPIPDDMDRVKGLAENLQLQDMAAQRLKNFRHAQGALSLETIEAKPIFDGDQIRALEQEEKNRAKEIIENFMIAANGVTARYLSDSKFPSIRRVVRFPKRWERILQIAADLGYKLPINPDSKALEEFLVRQRAADPVRFPDLSLAIIKLLGAGEYVAEIPDGNVPGHFGLAVKDYAHSTAPNRRYPDLITQRLLLAALEGEPIPYQLEELDTLASHCTQAEDAANKVERQVEKSAAALLFESRIGESFDSIVTGASEKGTWVRLLSDPVEGKLVEGYGGIDVGDRIRVQLISVDIQNGYIDFKKNGSSRR
jgi:exoribonuclease-2